MSVPPANAGRRGPFKAGAGRDWPGCACAGPLASEAAGSSPGCAGLVRLPPRSAAMEAVPEPGVEPEPCPEPPAHRLSVAELDRELDSRSELVRGQRRARLPARRGSGPGRRGETGPGRGALRGLCRPGHLGECRWGGPGPAGARSVAFVQAVPRKWLPRVTLTVFNLSLKTHPCQFLLVGKTQVAAGLVLSAC